MKIAAVGALWLCFIYHIVTVGNLEKEVVLLGHEINLHKTEAQVLRDQLVDMTFQFSSQRTYEEGVADGLVHSKNEDWVAGYHFCAEQFGNAPRELTTSK